MNNKVKIISLFTFITFLTIFSCKVPTSQGGGAEQGGGSTGNPPVVVNPPVVPPLEAEKPTLPENEEIQKLADKIYYEVFIKEKPLIEIPQSRSSDEQEMLMAKKDGIQTYGNAITGNVWWLGGWRTWFWKYSKEIGIRIPAYDDPSKTLVADYMTNKSAPKGRVAIVAHFLGGNQDLIGGWANLFDELGYSILAPDLRGHHNSPNPTGPKKDKTKTMGIRDGQDLVDWANYLVKNKGAKEIVLFGVSLGAISSLKAASIGLPPEVKAVVIDSGFADVMDFFKSKSSLQNLLGGDLAAKLNEDNLYDVVTAVDYLLYQHQGLRIKEGIRKADLEKARVPLLMVHGTKDEYMPMYMAEDIANHYGKNTGVEVKKYTFNATHAKLIFDSDNYHSFQDKIKAFLKGKI